MSDNTTCSLPIPGFSTDPGSEVPSAAARRLIDALDARQAESQPVQLWLRDDDAIEPSERLDRLLFLAQAAGVPVTVAVIPAFSGDSLAQRLQSMPMVTVAVHGWAHQNHAPVGEKKQELGAHRPIAQTLVELQRGLQHLQQLYGAQCLPLLVPPWNRISTPVVACLSSIGFRGLSTFADMNFDSIAVVNTHVDIIDWKGNGGGHESDALFAEITSLVWEGRQQIGILTHHLVHDCKAWHFLELLFGLTARHPGARWTGVGELLSATLPDPGLPAE